MYCKANFKTQYGTDLSDIQFPEASLSWRLFRYNNITRIVNSLSVVAKQHHKENYCGSIPHTRNCPAQCTAGLDELEAGWCLPDDLSRIL